jgi:hypothetical protein
VLEARILALSVLSDNAEVDIIVAGLVARDILDKDNGSVDIKLLSHSYVERLVAGSFNRCVQDSL